MESVKEIQGTSTGQEDYETAVDLDVDAYIPDSYIRNEMQKLDVYKRIAGIRNQDEYEICWRSFWTGSERRRSRCRTF